MGCSNAIGKVFPLSPLPPRQPAQRPQQVLDVLVGPADAAADEEGVVFQGIVLAAEQVEVGVELVAARQAQVSRLDFVAGCNDGPADGVEPSGWKCHGA